jgi:hypothetical protein
MTSGTWCRTPNTSPATVMPLQGFFLFGQVHRQAPMGCPAQRHHLN